MMNVLNQTGQVVRLPSKAPMLKSRVRVNEASRSVLGRVPVLGSRPDSLATTLHIPSEQRVPGPALVGRLGNTP